MSADDHLSPAQFYHGSRYSFSPGDELTVSGAQAVSGSSKRQLFFSDDAALASSFGTNVYRVSPQGDYTRKRRPREKQEPGFPTEYEYTTRQPLHVDREVDLDEITAARMQRKEHFLRSPEGRSWQARQGS